MSKPKTKRATNLVVNIILYTFLILCVISVFVAVLAKDENGEAAEIFGYQFMIVTTGSMGPSDNIDVSDFEIKSIPAGTLVVIETVPDDKKAAEEWYSDLEQYDVLTFKYMLSGQKTITHRITDIDEYHEGGYIIELRGDAVDKDDNPQVIYTAADKVTAEDNYKSNHIIGKVVATSGIAGAIIGFLVSPACLISIIVVCLIIIVVEVFKIVNAINAEGKRKALEENSKKEAEILELRRKLDEFVKNKERVRASPDDGQCEETEDGEASSQDAEESAEIEEPAESEESEVSEESSNSEE